jgi:hypothetical protein
LTRFLHSTPSLLKRNTDSKARHREERQAKKHNLEEKLEEAEEWLGKHAPSTKEPTLGKRSMLLEETDPFEMDELKEKLKSSLDRLKKEGSVIKQGRSDPEMLRRLEVQLPDNLGGKVSFLDIANVGPKPGDARSLQITVFDTEVDIIE